MKTPDPRGFAPQSFSATIGENAYMFSKCKAPPATADLDVLFEPKTFLRKNGARVIALTATPAPTFTTGIEEKKFYVPTGKFRTAKRTGKVTEEKIPMRLFTATLTISHAGGSFAFTATNRGSLVKDHRDGSRKTLAATRAELLRLRVTDPAALADLESVLSLYTPPKVKVQPLPTFRAPAKLPPFKGERETPAPAPDFGAMTKRQLAAYNRKILAASHAGFEAMLSHGLPEGWESLPEVQARQLP